MSDSVQPHRQQPTRLLCPQDSPGKNTGVDCHFLLQCMKVKSESEVTQLRSTLHDSMDCSPPVSFENPLSLGFSKQEYRSGLPFSSPRDLPDPGIEPGSPVLQADSLPSEPPGKPSFQVSVTIIFHLFVLVSMCALEKEMVTHSSTLAWKIPWTEEPW